MRHKKFYIISLCICFAANIFAQNVNTSYFMDEISTRNFLNPAFLPRCKSYFDFILLPNVYAGVGENAFSIQDLIYMDNNKPANLFSNSASLERFLNKLPANPYAKADLRVNILNFGGRISPGHYFLFDMNVRADVSADIPRDLLTFIFRGSSSINSTDRYDLNSLDVNANVYANLGFGYAGHLHDKVTFGIKAKFLLGIANLRTQVDELGLTTSSEAWMVRSNSKVYLSSPVQMRFSKNPHEKKIEFVDGFYTPAGYGASFDIGLTYEPIPYLTLSAAVVDLGFIGWNGFSYEGTLNTQLSYSGLGNVNYGDSLKMNTEMLKDLGNQMWNNLDIQEKETLTSSRIEMISGKFNAGIEYGVLKNKISFGVMNQLVFRQGYPLYDEVLLAVNFRPGNVLKASFSYSFINGHTGSIGAGLNFNFGAFSWYAISDYVPVTYTMIEKTSQKKIILPDRIQHFNIQTGVVFNIHRFENDLDDDGVPNSRDACKNTNMDLLRKQCPKMLNIELIDKFGCDWDEDGDGVNDCYDQCPGTPFGIIVDEYGCPADADSDGVPDSIDKCPGTPRNAEVDSLGCPVDTDGDSVPDYLDKCLDTPRNIEVDSLGCPIDTDNDSVPDYLDKCIDRPGPLSNNGCPELVEMRRLFKQAMNGIQFRANDAVIMPSSYPILNQIVSVLGIDTTFNVEINGHTDNVGDPEVNMALSKERAASVRQYLINHGINPDRITSNGFGDTQPVADNNTESGRQLNRRVEFDIVYERVTYKEQTDENDDD